MDFEQYILNTRQITFIQKTDSAPRHIVTARNLPVSTLYLLDVCVVVVVDADDMLWRPVIDVHVALLHSGRHLEIQKTLQNY